MEPQKNRLVQSMEEALAYLAGDPGQSKTTKQLKPAYVPEKVDVRQIRKTLRMSQTEFAARFALNVKTLRNWEYGRRKPDMTAKTYLYLIEKNPHLVEQSLRRD